MLGSICHISARMRNKLSYLKDTEKSSKPKIHFFTNKGALFTMLVLLCNLCVAKLINVFLKTFYTKKSKNLALIFIITVASKTIKEAKKSLFSI